MYLTFERLKILDIKISKHLGEKKKKLIREEKF